MFNLSDRLPENVAGPFYVTSDCIDCDMCRENAPAIFRRDDELHYSVVFHQPANAEEAAAAAQALEHCPVEAIRRDDT